MWSFLGRLLVYGLDSYFIDFDDTWLRWGNLRQICVHVIAFRFSCNPDIVKQNCANWTDAWVPEKNGASRYILGTRVFIRNYSFSLVQQMSFCHIYGPRKSSYTGTGRTDPKRPLEKSHFLVLRLEQLVPCRKREWCINSDTVPLSVLQDGPMELREERNAINPKIGTGEVAFE